MRPQFAATMSGSATWQQWNVPVRLTSIIRAHDSGVISMNGAKPTKPALVTKMLDRTKLAAHLAESLLDCAPVGHIDTDSQCGTALTAQIL